MSKCDECKHKELAAFAETEKGRKCTHTMECSRKRVAEKRRGYQFISKTCLGPGKKKTGTKKKTAAGGTNKEDAPLKARDYLARSDKNKHHVCNIDGVDKCLRVNKNSLASWRKYTKANAEDCEWDSPRGVNCESTKKTHSASAGPHLRAQDYYDEDPERKNDVCMIKKEARCLRVNAKDAASWHKKNKANSVDCSWDKNLGENCSDTKPKKRTTYVRNAENIRKGIAGQKYGRKKK